MAVVIPSPSITQRSVGTISYPDLSGIMASSSREIVEAPMARVNEDVVYVAVDEDVKKSRMNLVYALQNSRGRKICIVHVIVPAQFISVFGGKMPVSSLDPRLVRAQREKDKQKADKILDEYLRLSRQTGAHVEKLLFEADRIEKGIVELISLHGIKKLVMGAAADKHYSKKMVELRSNKAKYVCEQAPATCHIQFVCKGFLIHTRQGQSQIAKEEVAFQSAQASFNAEAANCSSWRSQSLPVGENNNANLSPALEISHSVRSLQIDQSRRSVMSTSSPDVSEGFPTIHSKSYAGGMYEEWDVPSRTTPSELSSSQSSSSGYYDIVSTSSLGIEENENWHHRNSSHLDDLGKSADDSLFNQLEQVMTEADNAKREALEESLKRGKAEKEGLNAYRKARASENLYAEEFKQRKEIEEALEREREQLDKMKNQRDQVMEELQIAQNQKSNLENKISEYDLMVKELEQKFFSAMELLENYKQEREELQMQRDDVLREAEELRQRLGEVSGQQIPRFFSEFPFFEIEEATQNFDPSLKIGEGGYGSIYRGVLRHTEVAIKMLHSDSMQGPSEFQQEVDVLSKIRHPNLVTLIGACPEAWILIYEYLPNGSLEDRLSCKDNSPPLSWQARIRLITELCSALIFLHSSKPNSIIHGDLKPANILLDANHACKLSDFGISRLLLSQDETANNNVTSICRTDPKGTFVYMDPEFLSTGELTTKSDVYSFGIILLRLLTGKPALRLIKEVEYAVVKGNLKSLLDPLAGDWPFVQAEQLTRLALRCCDNNRKNRPDLAHDVWRVLEPMRASCGGSSAFQLGSEEHFLPPPYFICPIFQEVMQDPHVAADGFTYEAEALKGWLDSGHDTSPMTNLKLDNTNLVPNRALRSAIQEWLQRN